MNICAVLGCKNTSEVGITFQKFPTDPDIREGWIKATGRKDWVPQDNSVICLAHFDGSQITVKDNKRLSLVHDAIPKVSLPLMIKMTTPSEKPDIVTITSVDAVRLQQIIVKQDIVISKQKTKMKLLETKLKRTLTKYDSVVSLLGPIQEKLLTLKNVNLIVQDILLKHMKGDCKGNMKTEM